MKKISPKPKRTSPGWSVRINDGYCTYQYEFPDGRRDVSINEVAEQVAKFLKAEPVDGEFVDFKKGMVKPKKGAKPKPQPPCVLQIMKI